MSQSAAQMDAAAARAEQGRQARREASRLRSLGRPQDALTCLERALVANPGDALTLNDHGIVLQELTRPRDALSSYDRALRLKPDFAAALVNRGNALHALGRLEEALRDLEAALHLNPAFPEALNSRGIVLSDVGRSDEALASFDQALALRGDFTLAHVNRGKLLRDLRRPREALAAFEVALRAAPEDAEALFGHASILVELELRPEQAAAEFERAEQRGIERTQSLMGRAAALALMERHAEGAACVEELLRLAPDSPYTHGGLLHFLLYSAHWSQLRALTAEVSERVRLGKRSTHPHALLSVCDVPALQLDCARAVVEEKYPPNPALGACPRRARGPAGGRIRVAYVSADFCEHPVSYLLVGPLERHDRNRFELIGVSLRQARSSPFGQRTRGLFNEFLDVTEQQDREVAAWLRERRVDIAVDLNGFTQGMRLGIFAHRAAPVQVSYLGYPGTLGTPYIDYLIADQVVIPPGEERWYAEQVVRLPGCYLPNDDRREIGARPTRASAGLPPQGAVLCAFANIYKINPAVFAIWMGLLLAVPDCVLWLREMESTARGNLQREAVTHGVDARRLIFAPRVASMAEHLGRQALADLYLDTLPYSAHSTACEALWAGVPVLTCAGRSMASRAAASALAAVGLPELVADSLEHYQRRALEVLRRPQELAALRARLAEQRLRSALFDTARYTRDLEAAYFRMHERVLRGEDPEGFTV